MECQFFILKSQSMIQFSRSFLPRSVERRPGDWDSMALQVQYAVFTYMHTRIYKELHLRQHVVEQIIGVRL